MRILLALLVAAALAVPPLVGRLLAIDDRPRCGYARSCEVIPVEPGSDEVYLVWMNGRLTRKRLVRPRH